MQVVASGQPRHGKPDLKITGTKIGRNADGHAVPIVTVANSSDTHGYLSRGRLTIVQRDASGRELIRQTLTGPDIQQGAGYGLIGGNEMRSFTLPLELPAEIGTIEARFRSEEHTSELQSLMRISYAVFCLKKKNKKEHEKKSAKRTYHGEQTKYQQ